MKRKILIVLILVVLYAGTMAQSLFEPNYALKSPQTVEIINIELKEDATFLNLSIENLIEGGYFCIDPETYLVTEAGIRYKLIQLNGLPLCPETYKFSRPGEIKYFTMKFPAIDKSTKWIDIIEECGENCLAFYGLSLDHGLNAELNICFRDIEKGRISAAIERFEALRLKLSGSGNPMLGSVYLNLVSLYGENGDNEKSDLYRNELRGLLIPHKELFLSGLK